MNEIPTPITRKEQYLAKAAGDNSVAVPEPITREEQYLNAIANNGGGGSSLPEVTSDDNGDVLTVVDGAWGKATPSGGGGQFIITVTPDEGETELSVDKTYQEIATAFAAGKTFYFYWHQYSRPFAASYAGEDEGTYHIEGVYVDIEAVAEDTADISFLKIYVTADSDNGVTAYCERSTASGNFSSIPPM